MTMRKTTDRGWSWVVMVSSFGAQIIHGFFLYGIGILNVAFLEKFDGSVSKTSWASGIFLGLFSICGPLSGTIINRWSCRVSMMAGGVLMTTGFVISAFVESLDALLISFGVLSGLGAGLSFTSSVVVVGFNFERRRNLATGVSVSGVGIGIFILSPLIQLAKDTYGYNGLLLMCGAVSFHHLVFGALCRPSELEKLSKTKDNTFKHGNEQRKRSKLLSIIREIFFLFSNIPFILIVVSMTFFTLGVHLMYVHFSKLLITKGTSETDAAYLLSMSGICTGISRLLIGFSSNAENINELMLFSGCFNLLGISGLLLPLYVGSYVGQACFAVMLGMYSGCCYSLLNTINVKLVGIEHLALAFGIDMFGAGFGSLIGPPISGWLEEAGWTYEQSFMVAGFACSLGGLFGWSVGCFDNGKASQTNGFKVGTTDPETIVVDSDIAVIDFPKVIQNGKENVTYDVTTHL